MKFILWTLVWWGLWEMQMWRIYKYRGVTYLDDGPTSYVLTYAICWILYVYLYNHFI